MMLGFIVAGVAIGNKYNLPLLPGPECEKACTRKRGGYDPFSSVCSDCADYRPPLDGEYFDPDMDTALRIQDGQIEII